MNIPGTPRGRQFTDARPNSKSVVVIALIFAAAAGWKGGGSSGVTLASNCLLSAGLKLKPPALPGNQTPERSGCPSAVRGAGPPFGAGCGAAFAPGWGALPSCAPTGVEVMQNSAKVAPTTAKQKPKRRFME